MVKIHGHFVFITFIVMYQYRIVYKLIAYRRYYRLLDVSYHEVPCDSHPYCWDCSCLFLSFFVLLLVSILVLDLLQWHRNFPPGIHQGLPYLISKGYAEISVNCLFAALTQMETSCWNPNLHWIWVKQAMYRWQCTDISAYQLKCWSYA